MLQLHRVNKTFPGGIQALRDVTLTIQRGEFVVIVGESGAGKSTLLRTINGLVRPDSGQVLVRGRDIASLGKEELRRLRRGIGLIFQDFNLVEPSPVLTNVLTGRLGYLSPWKTILGMFPPEDVAMAQGALERVGLADKMYNKARDLSGGQKQRVSIARALVQHPHTILADEPVASLDPPAARDILGWFRMINQQEGITVIVNLHDSGLAAEFGQRLVGMREGEIVHDGPGAEVDGETFSQIYGRTSLGESHATV